MTKTVSLNQILDEMAVEYFYDSNTLYKRFTKIRNLVLDKEDAQPKDKIVFDVDEKPFVMGLIEAMGENFLPKVMKQMDGKESKIKDVEFHLEEAIAFHDRMMLWIDKVSNEEIKKMMIATIEVLSRKEAWGKTDAIMKKINMIGILINEQQLPPDEYDKILNEIQMALDTYYIKLKAHFNKK